MKRMLCLLVTALLILSGCSEKLAAWHIENATAEGYRIVVADGDDDHIWYATVDEITGQVVSVALLYPASYGTVKSKQKDGAIPCEITEGEREIGGVMFFSFTADRDEEQAAGVMHLAVAFENKTVTLAFRFADIFAAP